jgi:monoamine oxidase
MPRTPLLHTIRQLLRDARASRATGVPMDEIRDLRKAAPKISRRALLGGAAAGAAVMMVPRGVRAAGKGTPTVAIVGGGIAGLNCALTLRDHGIASTVYEASTRVGGRMHSNNNGYWDANQVSEWCGELIDTGHKTIRNLAARYSLPLDDLHAAEPNGAREIYKFGGQYYPATQADADFGDLADILGADLKEAGYPTLYNAYNAAGLALDQMSIYDWIESRVAGGHGSPLGKLIDVAYNIEYGAETSVQSSLNLVYLLGYSASNSLALFGKSDERFHVRGGNERVPAAVAADLGSSVVKTGWAMTKLAQTSGGRYTVSFDHDGTSSDVTADYVVLALPFAVLANIDTSQAGFDSLKNTAIQTLGRGHNGKLQLQFTSRAWEGSGPWPGTSSGASYADTGYQNTWEVSRAQAGTPGILVDYTGGNVTDSMKTSAAFTTIADTKAVGTDAQRFLSQIAPVYPGLTWNGKATSSLPHKSNLLGASYSFWKVGQYTGFSGYEKAQQGGVLFCGEHTSQDFQGFMEGGASEGARAANDLIAILNGK